MYSRNGGGRFPSNMQHSSRYLYYRATDEKRPDTVLHGTPLQNMLLLYLPMIIYVRGAFDLSEVIKNNQVFRYTRTLYDTYTICSLDDLNIFLR